MAITEARAVLQPMRRWLLPFLLGASPALALFGPRATPIHVLIIGLAAALAVWTAGSHTNRGPDSTRGTMRGWLTEPTVLPLIVLLTTAWLSEFWSTNAGYGALTAFRLTAMAATGLFALAALAWIEPALRGRACSALAWGGTVLVGLYAVNAVTGGALVIHARHYVLGDPLALPELWQMPTRASAILVVTLWPLALVVARRIDWRLACALVALLVPCVFTLPMRAVILAFFVGLISWIVARWSHRKLPLVAGLALAAAVFILPPVLSHPSPRAMIGGLADEISQSSVAHRLKIWEFTLSKIDERPWMGWGLAASRELASTVDPEIREPFGPGISVLPLHPHNNALQVWVELGVLGALAFAAVCGAIGWKISHLGWDPAWRASAFATFATYMTIGGLSYGASQSWWVASAWLAAVFLAISHQPSKSAG